MLVLVPGTVKEEGSPPRLVMFLFTLGDQQKYFFRDMIRRRPCHTYASVDDPEG